MRQSGSFVVQKCVVWSEITTLSNETGGEEELLKDISNVENLRILLTQLCDKFGRLETTHEKVLGLITDEDGYDKEFTEGENYRDIFLTLRTKLENRISKLSESVNIHNETIVSCDLETVNKNRKFKLPKLELMKFSGDAREYLSFWSQFSKIHEEPDIVPEDEFQYLAQCIIPNSRAAHLIHSFPMTADNYPKAIEQLKERFGRDSLLVQIFVRDLLNLVMKNAVPGRSNTDLAVLYDSLASMLRALESLGRTKEKFADFLGPLVESCLLKMFYVPGKEVVILKTPLPNLTDF
ncbi:DUF1758 domain-containing protein [Trichonephila clavipes]|nr:DUF1758 domain-containing protein [Trichonephila clavipes]